MPNIPSITKINNLYHWLDTINDVIEYTNNSIKKIIIDNSTLTVVRNNDEQEEISLTSDIVISVNGKKGNVIIDDYVSSVTINGRVITVTKKDGTYQNLTPQDTVYTLPAATSTKLGGVKIGSNITNSSGTISITKNNIIAALGYVPPTQDTTYNVMRGATSSSAGESGLVPAPSSGKQNRPLRGDGTWADSLTCDIVGHSSEDLPLSGGTLTGTLKIRSSDLHLGDYSSAHTQLRSDASNFYILINQNNSDSYNTLRPFSINLSTGNVNFGHEVNSTTPDVGDNSTRVATTNFVRNAMNTYVPNIKVNNAVNADNANTANTANNANYAATAGSLTGGVAVGAAMAVLSGIGSGRRIYAPSSGGTWCCFGPYNIDPGGTDGDNGQRELSPSIFSSGQMIVNQTSRDSSIVCVRIS